jgi:hypothetical protein
MQTCVHNVCRMCVRGTFGYGVNGVLVIPPAVAAAVLVVLAAYDGRVASCVPAAISTAGLYPEVRATHKQQGTGSWLQGALVKHHQGRGSGAHPAHAALSHRLAHCRRIGPFGLPPCACRCEAQCLYSCHCGRSRRVASIGRSGCSCTVAHQTQQAQEQWQSSHTLQTRSHPHAQHPSTWPGCTTLASRKSAHTPVWPTLAIWPATRCAPPRGLLPPTQRLLPRGLLEVCHPLRHSAFTHGRLRLWQWPCCAH